MATFRNPRETAQIMNIEACRRLEEIHRPLVQIRQPYHRATEDIHKQFDMKASTFVQSAGAQNSNNQLFERCSTIQVDHP